MLIKTGSLQFLSLPHFPLAQTVFSFDFVGNARIEVDTLQPVFDNDGTFKVLFVAHPVLHMIWANENTGGSGESFSSFLETQYFGRGYDGCLGKHVEQLGSDNVIRFEDLPEAMEVFTEDVFDVRFVEKVDSWLRLWRDCNCSLDMKNAYRSSDLVLSERNYCERFDYFL